MKTLKEIASRKAELRTMLEDPKADLVAIEKELRELNEMQNQIETRERLIKEAGEINAGKLEKREKLLFQELKRKWLKKEKINIPLLNIEKHL